MFTLSEPTLYLALFHTLPLEIACYITYFIINGVLSILCLLNPNFVPMHNCIISLPIPTDAI